MKCKNFTIEDGCLISETTICLAILLGGNPEDCDGYEE